MDIVWNDKFKTGNSTIDEQHKHIIELLSGVNTLKLSKDELFGLLGDLQKHLATHLSDEENYMTEANYPDYESHKANHDKVLKDCKNILTQNAGNNTAIEIGLEFVEYIQNWFLDHYKNEDVKMVEYLKQHIGEIN